MFSGARFKKQARNTKTTQAVAATTPERDGYARRPDNGACERSQGKRSEAKAHEYDAGGKAGPIGKPQGHRGDGDVVAQARAAANAYAITYVQSPYAVLGQNRRSRKTANEKRGCHQYGAAPRQGA